MEALRASEFDDSMLARATAGDEIAFARIVAAYHSDMARVCNVVVGDAQLALEAVQAAWPRIWRGIGSIRDPQKLRPWLVAVAVNEARRLRGQRGRRQVREIAITSDVVETDAGGRGDPAERAALIDLGNSLARLNDRDRTIVGMRYAAGMSSAEIGLAIGMSSGGVRARIADLITVLRRDLSDE
ncbi:MAG: hypothetical protein QOJ81_1658 [Chloroflexota bacterium]|jgi:RNA polymerase sigma factor (sigma-70 family)|nr:hypothetical protein [Chloroflexota bacterium]